jgi:hypothetical protein
VLLDLWAPSGLVPGKNAVCFDVHSFFSVKAISFFRFVSDEY